MRADLGIAGDTITAVGDLLREPAGRTIDAAGLTVTPGFIDVHTHSDWRLWGIFAPMAHELPSYS